MPLLRSATGAVIIWVGLSMGPAHADLTAQQVWDSWKSTAESTGQTVSVANETYSGGVLTLEGITFDFAMPDGDLDMTIGTVTLTEGDDGSVMLTMPASYPIIIAGTDIDGAPLKVQLTVSQTDGDVRATGTPESISYAYSLPRTEVTIDEIEATDGPAEFALTAVLADTTGTYNVLEGSRREVESNFSAAALSMDFSFKELEDDIAVNMSFQLDDLVSASTGTLSPFASSSPNLAALLREGMTSQGTTTIGPMTYAIEILDPSNPVKISGSAAKTSADVSLSQDGMRYGGSNEEVTNVVELSNMPIPPIEINMARIGGELRMPMMATDTAQDFGFKLDFTDLVLSDAVWGMFDPGGLLPRDPANLVLDIAGLGKWNVDITDPAGLEALESDLGAPGEVETVDINTIELSMMGAQLDGSGGFQFDNSAPIPTPVGAVDFKLAGVQGLLDTLVAAGLLPEDQATGARMMLGLFAQPGEEPDTLESTIELTEDGSVLANGQRIR